MNGKYVCVLKYMSIFIVCDLVFSEAGIQDHSSYRRPQSLKIGHGGILDSAAGGVLGNFINYTLINVCLTSSMSFKEMLYILNNLGDAVYSE